MSWWSVVLAWGGWAAAVGTALALRRHRAVVADAEHELRGAATAIGLAAERFDPPGGLGLLLALELERMGAALGELAAARGASPAPAAELDAGRLAQVLGNVIDNATEHGVGAVEVRSRREGGLVVLEVCNLERRARAGGRSGRGRGLAIAQRAARELGGRLRVESAGGITRTVLELPERSIEAREGRDDDGRRAA